MLQEEPRGELFEFIVEELRSLPVCELQAMYTMLYMLPRDTSEREIRFRALKRALEKEMGYAQAAAWFPDGVK